uniref:Uncharacterized protein n=1 Tax=Romanomermis culicivorax TaxID=13658 RepID=A0A915J2V1_ROMCU
MQSSNISASAIRMLTQHYSLQDTNANAALFFTGLMLYNSGKERRIHTSQHGQSNFSALTCNQSYLTSVCSLIGHGRRGCGRIVGMNAALEDFVL